LTDEEANDRTRKFDATQQDKTEVARHRLVSRLPGIENKSQTISRVVTLPQSSVDEIKAGKVSLETAQKLGISTPETLTTQGLEVGHLPLPLPEKETQLESVVRLLRHAIAHGAESVRSVLGRLPLLRRWETVLALEEKFSEDMQRLDAIAPNWVEWCEVVQ
jgi:hypothetical protein